VEPVRDMIDEWWADDRPELDERPDITDRHGRVWRWWGKELYCHDGLLAWPRDMIDRPDLGLPSPLLADNPNYAGLCDICRSEWPT